MRSCFQRVSRHGRRCGIRGTNRACSFPPTSRPPHRSPPPWPRISKPASRSRRPSTKSTRRSRSSRRSSRTSSICTPRPTQASILVEQGEASMAAGFYTTYVHPRRASGIPLGLAVPKEGMFAMPKGIAKVKNAPAPELADAFIEECLAPEFQAVWMKDFLLDADQSDGRCDCWHFSGEPIGGDRLEACIRNSHANDRSFRS